MCHPMQMCDRFLFSLLGVDTLKYFLNSDSPVGSAADARTSCLSLLGVRSTRDGSSFSIVRRSAVIVEIGLNLVGTVGVGKNAQIVRSYSRITKFLLACWASTLGGAVRACILAWEGAAASEAAMVERGGSDINPHRLHVEKPTK